MKPTLKSFLPVLGLATSSQAVTTFDIVIDFGSSTFTASQQAAFTNAEATWESLITSYKDPLAFGTTLTISADKPYY